MVDTNKDAVKFHPENSIILEKWTGDIKDRTLWDLIQFLQSKTLIIWIFNIGLGLTCHHSLASTYKHKIFDQAYN